MSKNGSNNQCSLPWERLGACPGFGNTEQVVLSGVSQKACVSLARLLKSLPEVISHGVFAYSKAKDIALFFDKG